MSEATAQLINSHKSPLNKFGWSEGRVSTSRQLATMADILEDDSSPVVSERVQLLAKSIYDELEVLINDYGPESIGNLMPLVVNILESLDSALSDNQDNLNAVMELSEENQQLVSNYEREKQYRKEIEEKAILMEENNEREIAALKETTSTLELNNKSCINKIKNQSEQIEKLDERHEQLKQEYKELHDKNLELVRNLHGKMESMRETGGFMTSARHREDGASSSDVIRAPGFQDFTAVSKQKKKRQQPTLPLKARDPLLSPEEESFVPNTPAVNRVDSPEMEEDNDQRTPPDTTRLGDEYDDRVEEEEELEEIEEDMIHEEGFIDEEIPVNEQSLMAEFGGMDTFAFTGLDDILLENKQLHTDKETLSSQLETLNRSVMDLEMDKKKLEDEKDGLNSKLEDTLGEVKKLKKEISDNREELRQATEKATSSLSGPEGLRISRLEIAKVLRERNEWKEKYFSLLEHVRMNDELYQFKKKDRKSRWVDYFTALFSSTRRRQLEQSLIESSPHRPILTPGTTALSSGDVEGTQETEDQLYSGAGYSKTKVIPTLKRVGKKEDEVYMTSVCWVIPNIQNNSPLGSPVAPTPVSPSINTCRPMSFQEDGAKILCATAINGASFLSDCSNALSIPKGSEISATDESSISLVWICTGTDTLTKVSVLDTAAVGEVLETFAVCSTPIVCIAAVPSFDDKDPDVLASLSTKTRKPVVQQSVHHERPSSSNATVWMGSDSGVLYIHSAVSQWKRCIHADKLPAGIQDIIYSKGKVFVLLQNATVAVFVRFSDGDWDCDNYEVVTIAQKKSLPVTTMVAVKYNIWCAIGNSIYVLHSHHLRSEANFTVNSWKNAEVQQMLSVGDGVWVAFKGESVLRLFHATSFTHMQDLDVAPSIQKILVFGSEKRSNLMPVPVSCIVAAQNSLWVGTENGIILSFPFSRPTIVAEESGWEVIKEAEVGGEVVPEPFDVRTEEALDASMSIESQVKPITASRDNNGSGELKKIAPQPFNPFCNIDQVQLSIHCHVNAVSSLICVPGMVPKDISVFEPLGGVYIGPGEKADYKPTLFVMSCGEGHLDLRTADKVMQTVHAQEAGKAGIPTAASIISEKNYIMVWDIVL